MSCLVAVPDTYLPESLHYIAQLTTNRHLPPISIHALNPGTAKNTSSRPDSITVNWRLSPLIARLALSMHAVAAADELSKSNWGARGGELGGRRGKGPGPARAHPCESASQLHGRPAHRTLNARSPAAVSAPAVASHHCYLCEGLRSALPRIHTPQSAMAGFGAGILQGHR